MRRSALVLVSLLALAAPAAALAARGGSGDGTLVVRNGDDGESVAGQPVVVLVVHGSVIGRITDLGQVRIDTLSQAGGNAPEVSGATWHKDVSAAGSSTGNSIGTVWGGTGLRFRAVDGWYRITIWGSKVNLFAIGSGKATLTGQPDSTTDGTYSFGGGVRTSLPDLPTTTSFPAPPPADSTVTSPAASPAG